MPSDLALATRSQQRFPTSAQTGRELATHYFGWLRSATLGLVRTDERSPDTHTIRILGLPLIRMARETGEGHDQERLVIYGGLLARPGGWFSFYVRDEQAVVTLEGYRSSYSDALYRMTQGPLHEIVMVRYATWWIRRRS
jgi:hypothetical protein